MNDRIVKLTLAALVAGAMFVAAGSACAQQPAVQGVVGTWALVSETTHQGEKTTEPLGPNPLGSIIFDRGGRFILMIARTGLPKFAANKRDAGTPEENKAVLAGSLAFFGRYSVSEADQVITLHVEASTFPNWIGTDQRRSFTLAGDEMKWINRTPAIGAEAVEVVWKRTP
jgi:hypothetical protein